MRRFLRPSILAAAALALLTPLPAAAQVAHQGRFCFTATVTERETGAVTPNNVHFQYEATSLGGAMYAIAGRALTSDQPFIATGYGLVVGNELYMNLTTTQTHADGWKDTGINQTRLNLATMTGTFYEIGHDYSPVTRQSDTRYTAGTLAPATCR